ncbi:MAG: hypothetical protein AAFQ68_04140, partial [Bacteroidota bacterium]
LLVWSILYFKARVLSYDSAWHLFTLVQEGTFLLDHDRFLVMAIQGLPLLLVKLGASLKTVMLSYSMSWVLFPYLIYLLLVYGLRAYQAAILLPLSLVLNPGVSFFYLAAELPLSLGVFALLVAWLSYFPDQKRISMSLGFLVAILLIVIASYGRMLIGGVIFAYLLFEGIAHERWKERLWQGLVAFTVLWFGMRVMLIPTDSYEGGAIRNMAQIFDASTYFSRPDFLQPWFRTTSKVLWPCYLVSIVLIGNYLYRRNWLLSLYVLGVMLAFSVLSIWYSPFGALGADHYLMMWGGIIAWPMLTELKTISTRWLPPLIVGSLLLIGLINLHQVRRHFVKRVAYLEFALEENAKRQSVKTISLRQELDHNYFWVDWSLGVESLLLSSMISPDSSQTIFAQIPAQDTKVQRAIQESGLWLGPHFREPYPASALNPYYFRLPDQPYQKLAPPPYETR